MEHPRVHVQVSLDDQILSIRDLIRDDIERIAAYWLEADDAFLMHMGVSREKLGTRETLAARFLEAVPHGDYGQKLAFAIELDNQLIGYTNLNHYSADHNVSHWHLMSAQCRGMGISTALYPYRIRTYFACTNMEKLTHQTRTTNIAMNRVLDHFLPVAETCFLSDPDGLAAPGDFNIRYLHRADVPRILARAGRQ
jgi:RimJ/RimL family protein N-acetyltransferase